MIWNHPLGGRLLSAARRATLVTAAALAAAAVSAPGAAHAGAYKMYACNVPGHGTGNRGPWFFDLSTNGGVTNLAASDTCSSGGPLALARFTLGMDPNSMAGIGMAVPDGFTISEVRSYIASSLTTSGSPASVLAEIDGIDYGLWSAPGNDNSVTPYIRGVPTTTRSFYWMLFCGAVASQRCDFASTEPLRLYGVQTTVSESVAPGAAIDGGTLATAGAKKGTKTVTVTGTDGHSGVQRLEVLLDDVVVGTMDYSRDWTRPLSYQKTGTCSFATWNACPLTQRETFAVDTAQVPDGAYALAVRATDAAGNTKTTTAAQPVTVDNTAPAAPAATSATSVTTEAASTDITWSHPGGQVAPITAAHVNVCGPTGSCQDIVVPASGATGGATINRTDGFGLYTAKVSLEDGAGNHDPAQAKTYRVTFAQTPAPTPTPTPMPPVVTPLPAGAVGPTGPTGPTAPTAPTALGSSCTSTAPTPPARRRSRPRSPAAGAASSAARTARRCSSRAGSSRRAARRSPAPGCRFSGRTRWSARGWCPRARSSRTRPAASATSPRRCGRGRSASRIARTSRTWRSRRPPTSASV
jgi:hypothetical protein